MSVLSNSVDRNHSASSLRPDLGSWQHWKVSRWGQLQVCRLHRQLRDSSVQLHLSQIYSVVPAPRPQKAKTNQKPLPEAFAEDRTKVCISEHFLCATVLHCRRQATLALWAASHSLGLDLNGAKPFASCTAQSYPNAGLSHLARGLVHRWTSPCSQWHPSPPSLRCQGFSTT